MFALYMPLYRIHRLKDAPKQNFRWAAHTAGAAVVKPKDYELHGEVEAPSPYASWAALKDSGQPLDVGDLLEDPSGQLRIFKYVGFEEARWVLPEPHPGVENNLENVPAPAPGASPNADAASA
ncbi:MAG: hypothetical protein JJE04_26420 [Acidobacteriia bacterium]|nr:hypothetical protein [Terriglobia bacterium]